MNTLLWRRPQEVTIQGSKDVHLQLRAEGCGWLWALRKGTSVFKSLTSLYLIGIEKICIQIVVFLTGGLFSKTQTSRDCTTISPGSETQSLLCHPTAPLLMAADMAPKITSSPSTTSKNSPGLKSVSFAPPEPHSGHQETWSGAAGSHADGFPATSVTGELTESPVESSPAGKEVPPAHSGPSNAIRGSRDLKTELNEAFQISPYNERSIFLPATDLERIITRSSVRGYCSTYAAKVLGDQEKKVSEYVFGNQRHSHGHDHARHVFAVLVLIDEPALIPDVIEHDISDKDLPLAQCDEKGTNYQLARRKDVLIRPIDCLTKWNMTQRKAFNEWQYSVKPLVFNQLDKHQVIDGPEFVAMKLADLTVLPFTSYDGEQQIVSGFSKVVRVKIHPAHHKFKEKVPTYTFNWGFSTGIDAEILNRRTSTSL